MAKNKKKKRYLSENRRNRHGQRLPVKETPSHEVSRRENKQEKDRQRSSAVRDHKNRLFIRLFSEPKELLELYNAVNGSRYTDASQLTVNTLEDTLYLGMKNDVSFLIGSEMNLYEHQSTWNPNMPLRGLFYFARLFQGYVDSNGLDIYSRVRLRLPVPRYVVFYNGTEHEEERWELKLSDSFEKVGKESDKPGMEANPWRHSPSLECTALVLNINFGHNKELMAGCRRLYEYAYLISRIRYRLSQGMTLEGAIDLAIDDCIREGILSDFLTKHRGEAVMDLFTEIYSVERHDRLVKRDAKEEGRAEGRIEGRAEGRVEGRAEGDALRVISLICRKLSRGKTPEVIADEVEEDVEVIRPVCEIARSFAPDYDYEKIYEAALEAGVKFNLYL